MVNVASHLLAVYLALKGTGQYAGRDCLTVVKGELNGYYVDQRYALEIPIQCISMSTASCITTLIYTVVDFYLLMVLALSMSTATRLSTSIQSVVYFQIVNGT